MRIGVICEGPTDFYALKGFFTNSLVSNGITADFIAIQPEIDKTQPVAGWGSVLHWLDRNPPNFRLANYFNGGLFGGGLATVPFDCLLIQIDTDILGHASFVNYLSAKHAFPVLNPTSPSDRAQMVANVIAHVGKFEDMTAADVVLHIVVPAVESTENWCIASFHPTTEDYELINGQSLIDRFMACLERSEGSEARATYGKIDKNISRRQRFVEVHQGGSARIEAGCAQFKLALEKLKNVGG